MRTDKIATFVRASRKAAGLTQKEFAIRSGLGLRFVHDLEQGRKPYAVSLTPCGRNPGQFQIPEA